MVFHNLSDYEAHLFIKELGKTGGSTKTVLGSLQKTRGNTSVLMLKLTSSWKG